MDYPNLLESAFLENALDGAEACSTESAAGVGGETAPRALVWRQLRWVDRRPVLELEAVEADPGKPRLNGAGPAEAELPVRPAGRRLRVPLTPGAYLGLRVALDVSGAPYRFCSGYTTGSTDPGTPGTRRHPCPEAARIDRGQQCPRCAARDEFTALHSAHLYPGTLTESMRAYAMLEHRLYIATFPDGTHKVGTSSLHSTPRRLDEQAVATATYIALAPDGLAIRRAEDAVTALAKIPQVKQVASKYRAWTNPLPGAQLRVAHQEAVARAREALAELARTDPEVPLTALDEPWIPSLAMNRPYAALRAQSPEPLAPCESGLGGSGTESGAAGFFCTGAAGQFLSAHTGDADAAFLVNTAAWRNVLVEPAQEFTRVRVQGSLF